MFVVRLISNLSGVKTTANHHGALERLCWLFCISPSTSSRSGPACRCSRAWWASAVSPNCSNCPTLSWSWVWPDYPCTLKREFKPCWTIGILRTYIRRPSVSCPCWPPARLCLWRTRRTVPTWPWAKLLPGFGCLSWLSILGSPCTRKPSVRGHTGGWPCPSCNTNSTCSSRPRWR